MTEPSIHQASLPNRLAPGELRVRPGADGTVAVDPERAGWRYLSFATVALSDGATLEVGGAGRETAAVIVGGGGLDARIGAERVDLVGRASPFHGLPSAVYVPAGQVVPLTARTESPGGTVWLAIASAPPSGRDGVLTRPVVITPGHIRIELRGASNASRQINHIIAPEFGADRLLLVEVFTPSGNWSSWPPHKHDVDAMPGEAVLEEIYHYQFRRPEAWAIQRLYRRPGDPAELAGGPRDGLWAVRHGELVLVTDGYHPFAAAHGDDAYYLNALAGDRRTMACSFDPDLDFVRDAWTSMAVDPRLPFVERLR